MILAPNLPEVSDDDWAATPASVRNLVVVLLARLALLEARVAEQDLEIARLREQLGKTSRNSSSAPFLGPARCA